MILAMILAAIIGFANGRCVAVTDDFSRPFSNCVATSDHKENP
jgi:hypothetical protein